MSRVGFETTTPGFERPKTVRTLDRAATRAGIISVINTNYPTQCSIVLENVRVAQWAKKLPASYGPRRFTIVFTGVCHWISP
jgi:hypothetical protein